MRKQNRHNLFPLRLCAFAREQKKTLLLGVLALFLVTCVPSYAEPEWAQAIGPWEWSFPRDHGSHPDFRTEWWYFTGNLHDAEGQRYGYQLTFFRQGLRKDVHDSDNPWTVRDVYFAHFTVTDVGTEHFQVAERISREGPGLAGASAAGMNVWILDWSAVMAGSVISISAEDNGMALELELRPRKPLVFHGEKGLSTKGAGEGQASYYTSFTYLETRGTVKPHAGAASVSVTGTSWFDQEFGSNQLSSDQVGWDWFSLHLSDGRDVMVYLLLKKDGSADPASSGTLVEPDGSAHHLELKEISLDTLDTWKSPHSQGVYPSRWRLSVPKGNITLEVAPLVADQELNTTGSVSVTYWEGAVGVTGESNGRPVTGEGYVELTGYAGSLGGTFLGFRWRVPGVRTAF